MLLPYVLYTVYIMNFPSTLSNILQKYSLLKFNAGNGDHLRQCNIYVVYVESDETKTIYICALVHASHKLHSEYICSIRIVAFDNVAWLDMFANVGYERRY